MASQQLLDQNGIPIFLAISFCALCVGRKRFEHTWHYSKTSPLSPDKKKKNGLTFQNYPAWWIIRILISWSMQKNPPKKFGVGKFSSPTNIYKYGKFTGKMLLLFWGPPVDPSIHLFSREIDHSDSCWRLRFLIWVFPKIGVQRKRKNFENRCISVQLSPSSPFDVVTFF